MPNIVVQLRLLLEVKNIEGVMFFNFGNGMALKIAPVSTTAVTIRLEKQIGTQKRKNREREDKLSLMLATLLFYFRVLLINHEARAVPDN